MRDTNQASASRAQLHRSQRDRFPYEINAYGLRVRVRKGVFSPRDFYGWKTFTRAIQRVRGNDILEIGTGTGVTALALAKRGARSVLAVDVNPAAVRNARENVVLNGLSNVTVRKSDIFSAIRRHERFDVIYWNTPFIWTKPSYKYRSMLERALFDPGYRLTKRLLFGAKKHLKPAGRLLVGTGDFGDVPRLQELTRNFGYKSRMIAHQGSVEVNPVTFVLYEFKEKDHA